MNRSSNSQATRLFRSVSALVLGALLAGFSCSEPQNLDITGETHFLRYCQEAAECGAGVPCVCGVCTRPCGTGADCTRFPQASCIASADTRAPLSCEGPPPAGRCDVTCRADADCAVLSGSHYCELGSCRDGANGGGAGGGAGAGASGAGGAGGASSDCARGEVAGNQLVVLGDSFMAGTHQITAEVENLARAAGALPAGQRYRDESMSLNNALALGGNGILNQYASAAADDAVSVVIMNGGGADVLAGSCEGDAVPSCPVITAAATAAEDLFSRFADDGVSDVVYLFYPDPEEPTLREKMDVLRSEIELVCAESPVPCHFIDLRPVFAGHYAEYLGPDGLNPSAAGAVAAAAAIWATMQDACIAQ